MIWHGKPPFADHALNYGTVNDTFSKDFRENTQSQYYTRCIVGFRAWAHHLFAGLWAKEKSIILQQQDGQFGGRDLQIREQ